MRTEQDDLAAYIGLDWGDQHHAVQLQAVAGGPVERLKLEQRPDVLHAWAAQLRQRFGGRPVGIAIEQCKGAVIHALMQYEFLVLYPVNPKALARYREVFAPSGAKDDPTDAALLLDLVRTHRAQLRPWQPETVTARKLDLLCEHRRKLVNRCGAVTNRLTSLLKQYFPQALDWVGSLDSRQACDFLAKWPTLAAVQRARPATVRRFYQQHNCRRAAVIDARLAQIATAQALTTDPAIVDALSLVVHAEAAQLRPLPNFAPCRGGPHVRRRDRRPLRRAPRPGPLRQFPRRRSRRRAAAGGRLRHRPHPVGCHQRAPVLRRHCARDRTQREDLLGASSPGLSEVPQADLSRVRGPVDPTPSTRRARPETRTARRDAGRRHRHA